MYTQYVLKRIYKILFALSFKLKCCFNLLKLQLICKNWTKSQHDTLTLTIQAALEDLHSNEALKLRADHMAFNESMP